MRSIKISNLIVSLIVLQVVILFSIPFIIGCSSTGPVVRETSAVDWGLTWGGVVYDCAWGVDTNDSGCVWVATTWEGKGDLDPGPAVEEHYGWGATYSAISKFDAFGELIWTAPWGMESASWIMDVAVDETGNAYAIGCHAGNTDFDPSDAEENRTAEKSYDLYISKFDTDGNFQWVQVWENDKENYFWDVEVDESGNVWAVGQVFGSIDLDPTDEIEVHGSSEEPLTFLCHLDSAGNYLWSRTLVRGGDTADSIRSVGGATVAVDSLGNAWAVVANGVQKYDLNGNLLFEKAWVSDDGKVSPMNVAVDDSGNVWVKGTFRGLVDFDPGAGEEIRDTSMGEDHSAVFQYLYHNDFICKLKADGTFRWVRTWGVVPGDYANAIAVDADGNCWVSGIFKGTVDLEPGEGVIELTASESGDVYQTKFDTHGNFLWTRAWGGSDLEVVYNMAADNIGNSYTVGQFRSSMDFDLEDGQDEISSVGYWDAYMIKISAEEIWE